MENILSVSAMLVYRMIPAYDLAMRKLTDLTTITYARILGRGFTSTSGMEKLKRSRYARRTEKMTIEMSIRNISHLGEFCLVKIMVWRNRIKPYRYWYFEHQSYELI